MQRRQTTEVRHQAGLDKLPRLFSVPTQQDERGFLSVAEGDLFPFAIRRVYYLYGVPVGTERGRHGHRKLQQVLVCMAGSVEVEVNNGLQAFDFKLDKADQALFIPEMTWRTLKNFSLDAVVVVFASEPYSRDDFIMEFSDFLREARSRSE